MELGIEIRGKQVVVSREREMLSIDSSCDYYLEAVDPLPA